jgi:hypothetical protein
MFHPVLVLFVSDGFSAIALHYSKHPRLALASGSRERLMENQQKRCLEGETLQVGSPAGSAIARSPCGLARPR